MDVWNYILGYRNTLKSVFETWVVHIPFKALSPRLAASLSVAAINGMHEPQKRSKPA